MRFFVRAVVSGFGFSLGSALFKRVSDRMGLSDESEDSSEAEDGGGQTDDAGDAGERGRDESPQPTTETGPH